MISCWFLIILFLFLVSFTTLTILKGKIRPKQLNFNLIADLF